MNLFAGAIVGGKYRLVEEIGGGGMGTVWRARSLRLDTDCALKILSPDWAAEPRLRARFMQEARAAARLRSPYVVSVFDVDEWNGLLYIVMELLHGQTLGKRLAEQGPLSPELTCDIMDQVTAGLHVVHGQNLIHRDVKPDNLIIERARPLMVKLLDFGVVKKIASQSAIATNSGVLIGTPHYMSPEQIRNSTAIDFRSDLWSLSVVTFECLTGTRPFCADSLPSTLLRITGGPIPSLRAARPNLPPAAEKWWRRATSRDPQMRPQSAQEFADTLREALLNADEEPARRASRQSPRRVAESSRGTRSRVLATSLAVLALAAAAGATYALSRVASRADGLPHLATPRDRKDPP